MQTGGILATKPYSKESWLLQAMQLEWRRAPWASLGKPSARLCQRWSLRRRRRRRAAPSASAMVGAKTSMDACIHGKDLYSPHPLTHTQTNPHIPVFLPAAYTLPTPSDGPAALASFGQAPGWRRWRSMKGNTICYCQASKLQDLCCRERDQGSMGLTEGLMGGLMGRAMGGMLGGVARQLQQQQQQVCSADPCNLLSSCLTCSTHSSAGWSAEI